MLRKQRGKLLLPMTGQYADRLARLAVVPMVLEARGLDVTPASIARFRAALQASS